MTYSTIDTLRRRIPKTAGLFFAADTMRFFNSKVESNLKQDRYFVTSEAYDDDAPRLYTVREATGDDIRTVGKFQQHRTKDEALEAIEKLITELLYEELKDVS